jgi:ADP-ribosylglycohydrolase
MLWSAYGDALGFITELADAAILRRRIGGSEVIGLVPWKRRVGGRFGVDLELPKGCYSDDTQLRLATCRAIRHDGTFDVDVFAKVELPVWRAYALGAGTGSKAAAQSLGKPDIQWSGNFFDTRWSRYVDGGGNGAAMRIQPHVWAAKPNQRDSEVVRDMIRNAITTHGHPRGILGAVFHGLCLLHSMHEDAVPSIDTWQDILNKLRYTAKIVRSDDTLATFWVPCWEHVTRARLDEAFDAVISEIECDLVAIKDQSHAGDPRERYENVVRAIGGLRPECRGSGTKTAILASYLAFSFRDEPIAGLHAAANLLGSDTDTIGTMGGAILGTICRDDPPDDVLDKPYLESEATRLFQVSQGQSTASFKYPDLIHWHPPVAEIDVVGVRNGEWFVAGLGKATPVWEAVEKGGKAPTVWQWFVLDCGQHLLLKRRPEPHGVQDADLPFSSDTVKKGLSMSAREALERAVASALDPREVGDLLLQLARQDDESAAAFASMVVGEIRSGATRDKSYKP